ncbi:hypothetical protein M427DRAFT_124466 [Gonapodya prolifera JEL478]|uniref:NAD(P)-binding domain-containing protein n=1 Tax=Gonapodya prolifera (strain JEL478) TaxID=1344416 RepID=A0A139ACE0_GONPJ|nr:hypothetical protein M427DRAFT_124466 [Gonapodya prolifera JEL478]|eukprot:KXS14125.1 hypothetical protein M427DRAFT_124466 [Gonapodya prolifera JEL478]
MHLILTGATGLVGLAALDGLVKAKDVTKITILARRSVPMADALNDPRINVLIQKDFLTYDQDLLAQLRGATGCVWALGISQTEVSKSDYIKITQDFTLAAARAFASLSAPTSPFRFVYVSGEGATHTPGFLTPVFGRVKGATELALDDFQAEHPTSFHVTTVRPGGVDPTGHTAIAPYLPQRFNGLMMRTMLPVMRTAVAGMTSPTEPLGRFLAELAMGKWDTVAGGEGAGLTGLDGVQVLKGGSRIVKNVAFRKAMEVGK